MIWDLWDWEWVYLFHFIWSFNYFVASQVELMLELMVELMLFTKILCTMYIMQKLSYWCLTEVTKPPECQLFL